MIWLNRRGCPDALILDGADFRGDAGKRAVHVVLIMRGPPTSAGVLVETRPGACSWVKSTDLVHIERQRSVNVG
jgi:hypothetical protein